MPKTTTPQQQGLSLCTSPEHDYVPSWLSLSREAAGKGLALSSSQQKTSCLSKGPKCVLSRAWIGGSMTDRIATEDPGQWTLAIWKSVEVAYPPVGETPLDSTVKKLLFGITLGGWRSVQFPAPILGSLQSPITLVPRDLTISSGLWAPARTWYTYIHTYSQTHAY